MFESISYAFSIYQSHELILKFSLNLNSQISSLVWFIISSKINRLIE